MCLEEGAVVSDYAGYCATGLFSAQCYCALKQTAQLMEYSVSCAYVRHALSEFINAPMPSSGMTHGHTDIEREMVQCRCGVCGAVAKASAAGKHIWTYSAFVPTQ